MKMNIKYCVDNQGTVDIPISLSRVWTIASSIMNKYNFDLKSGIYCEEESRLSKSVIFRFDVPFDNFFKYSGCKYNDFYISGAFTRTYFNRNDKTSFSFIFIANDFNFTEEFKNFIFLHEVGHIKEDVEFYKSGKPANTEEDDITKLEHEFYADEFATIHTDYNFKLVEHLEELRIHETTAHDFYMKYYLKKSDEEILNWNKQHKLNINKEMLFRIKHQDLFIKLIKSQLHITNAVVIQ